MNKLTYLILAVSLFAFTVAQQPLVVEVKKDPKDIVVREVNENDGKGNFYWLRETLDGGRSEQIGYLEKAAHNIPTQVIEGSYTEIGADGQPKTVNYIADRTGYHPVGAHLPRSPPALG